jgi:hypothetical protein
VIFVVFAPLAARAGVALSARMALRVEPTHHDPVERFGPLGIRAGVFAAAVSFAQVVSDASITHCRLNPSSGQR